MKMYKIKKYISPKQNIKVAYTEDQSFFPKKLIFLVCSIKKLLRLATVVYIILFKTFAYVKVHIHPLQIVIKNNETFQPKSLLENFS